jgi:hypothetical protein
MIIHETPEAHCPTCGKMLNRACQVDFPTGEPIAPKPGDLTVCVCCGDILVMDEEMKLKVPDLDTLMAIPPAMARSMERAQKFVREKRPVKPEGQT